MTTAAPVLEKSGEQRDDDLALLAKALGHPARVRILRLLLSRDACYCGQIVDEIPLAQATVSQHLKVLKDAGLVSGEIEGLRTCYCASRERLAERYELLGRCWRTRSRWIPVAAIETVRRPAASPPPEDAAVLRKLSTLDRFLPLWIALAMARRARPRQADPEPQRRPRQAAGRHRSLPIALGLLLMMYPVLAKVRYEELGRAKTDGVSDRRFFGVSLFLSWVSGRCSCSRWPGCSSPTSPPTAPA